MPINGTLEVTVSFNRLPTDVTERPNGWTRFAIECDERSFVVDVRPRMWQKLLAAEKETPGYQAVITGKLGKAVPNGYELLDVALEILPPKG
jgi:hypothetical protein